MIRTLALLCFFSASALGFFDPGFKVKFGMTGFETDCFIDMPKTMSEATALGYLEMDRPKGPTGLASLVMYCSSDSCDLCLLYDDTGYIAGVQLAFDQSRVSDQAFDWETQGYTNWTTTVNGETKNYYTIQQYYISGENLKIDPEIRIASRNASLLLQFDNVWVTGFYGELYNISTTTSDFTGEGSIYTKQSCIPMMGNHYYYNVTETSTCASDTMLPWFAVVVDGQLVGVGFYCFCKYSADTNTTDLYEYSGELAMRINVPYAADCVYNLASSPGQVTEHIYFIAKPNDITCQ